MSFDSLLIHTITIRNPVADSSDRYGNPTFTESSVASRARVAPFSNDQELLDDRDTRITRFRIFLPPDTLVSGLSNLDWEGRILRVVGEPRPYAGRSVAHHLELTAEEILG